MAIAQEALVEPEWTLGDRLRKAREHAGFDQAGIAAELGVSAQVVSRWETDRGRPRDVLGTVRRWAEITRVSQQWLLGVSRSFSWSVEMPGQSPALSVVDPVLGPLQFDYDEPERSLVGAVR